MKTKDIEIIETIWILCDIGIVDKSGIYPITSFGKDYLHFSTYSLN